MTSTPASTFRSATGAACSLAKVVRDFSRSDAAFAWRGSLAGDLSQTSPARRTAVCRLNPNVAIEGRRPGNVIAQGEALGWPGKQDAALKGRDITIARHFVPPFQGLGFLVAYTQGFTQGFTQGYYMSHLRRLAAAVRLSTAVCRLKSLTTFASDSASTPCFSRFLTLFPRP